MSYTRLGYHVVFSTKERRPQINPEWEDRLFGYAGGILRRKGGTLVAMGGARDHVHMLVSLPSDLAIATAVRFVKSNTSKWLHETVPGTRLFAWQEGYGAFTVSHSLEDRVIAYIRDQKEHHRKKTFKEEFLAFLEKHKVAYDPRYIWT